MAFTERQRKILEILQEKKQAKISDLSQKLYVSEMSARRDLAVLGKANLVKRYRGGAFLIEDAADYLPISLRVHLNEQKKEH